MTSLTLIESSRFGPLQVEPEDVIDFPLGMIGLPGHRYTLLDRNPDSGFLWLQSLDEPALSLPVVDPRRFFSNFALSLSEEDRERVSASDLDAAAFYVTVRAAKDPADIVVNLRAPIIVWEQVGHQLLNHGPGASLEAPLFAAPETSPGSAE
jgi:flagellar assembly factor FliW